mgnify:FL=1|jgi:ribbon-helix-helix protein, copG family|nr:MAG TPA: Ribbon-helix-helix protein, copG family [Caudoviricetes sp.]
MTNLDNINSNKVGRPFLPNDERKDYKITIRVDKELKKMIDELADSKNLSRAELFRKAIEEYSINHKEE